MIDISGCVHLPRRVAQSLIHASLSIRLSLVVSSFAWFHTSSTRRSVRLIVVSRAETSTAASNSRHRSLNALPRHKLFLVAESLWEICHAWEIILTPELASLILLFCTVQNQLNIASVKIYKEEEDGSKTTAVHGNKMEPGCQKTRGSMLATHTQTTKN